MSVSESPSFSALGYPRSSHAPQTRRGNSQGSPYPLIRSARRPSSFRSPEEGYTKLALHVISGRPAKASESSVGLIRNRTDIVSLLGIADRVFLLRDQRERFLLFLSHMFQAQVGQDDRLDGSTYPSHPMNVTKRVFGFGVKDLDTAGLTILHDEVENSALGLAIATGELVEGECDSSDTTEIRDLALEGVRKHHGPLLSNAVEAISSPDFRREARRILPRGTDEEIRVLRYRLYRKFLGERVVKNPRALIGKSADTLENGSSLEGLDPDAQQRRREKYADSIEERLMPSIETTDSPLILPHKEVISRELMALSAELREGLRR